MEPERTFMKKAKIELLSNYIPILLGYLNKMDWKMLQSKPKQKIINLAFAQPLYGLFSLS